MMEHSKGKLKMGHHAAFVAATHNPLATSTRLLMDQCT